LPTRFDSLELGNPGVFGIRLHGAFGRGDRGRLVELGERCLERGKIRLLLDCRDLESLGGGGAQVLADLQRRLQEQGGGIAFVAVNEVVDRFLRAKFKGLTLRCFASREDAVAAFDAEVPPATTAAAAPASQSVRQPAHTPVSTPAPQPAGAATGPQMVVDGLVITDGSVRPPDPPARPDLDSLLVAVEPDDTAEDATGRRTADIVTAVYVSLDDMLTAVQDSDNPTLLGEALAQLLDSHDLAAATVFCHPQGDYYVAIDGSVRVPVQGGIVASLVRTYRPLTLLDLDDGDLWDEESQLLEELQPDLILPLMRAGCLAGVAFLQRGGDEREYGISEMFALELLQRLLMRDGRHTAAADGDDRAVRPAPVAGQESLLMAELELVRGLQDAQDMPHFWQIVIARLRQAAEVTSLLYLDSETPAATPFLAGEARRGLQIDLLGQDRIRTFFRMIERPVEIVNMPASLQEARDTLLASGLQWLVGLRADGTHLGVAALGLRWRTDPDDVVEAIGVFTEIIGEALQRLREGQLRAEMNLGLIHSLLVGDEAHEDEDAITRSTVEAVRLLATELGLSPDQIRDLVLGALLRNLGQQTTDVDDLTADKLTGAQWESFREHPERGDRRLAELNAPTTVRDAVRHHHERFDGRGFPLGLSGRDIPLAARLVAVAQHHALHRLRHGDDAALDALQAEADRALDPDLVEIFSSAARRLQPVPALS
jgi:HD-GYP domain-containing protein (c-di-GMP phosphodiesterase class II)